MAALDDLLTRRDAVIAEIAALDATKAGGKPNTSGSNTVDHVGYKDALYRELDQLNRLVSLLEGPDKDVRYGVV